MVDVEHFSTILFMTCSLQFLEYLNVISCIDGFPIQQKISQYASLSIPENISHNFVGQWCSCGLLLGMLCDAIPLSVISFLD
jgi:hypothetical protein